ncbi:aldo/keto reductase [Bacillus sp. AFS017336]|uniref:aldo/keto reductase n=1 Tax=Bacillus sp. AFS017336 TaxID=2033489 RepID=UPI000BF0CD65|nr:aldo/keto reductase [Bacillus sp. AFS017336]PEL11104.1 oxidoreductase [Bacillus sp. AFS017336]
MKKRKLGSTLLQISEIGLGCMSLGTEDNEAISTIHAAIDAGINYFDTADLYDFGKNEEIVGKGIKGRRDQVILATKVGNRWNNSNDKWHWDPSGAYIKEAVKASLRRLNTDYIDYYQLHGGTIDDQYEETVYTFEELVKEGLIRYYGISSIRPNVINRFVNHSSIQGVMMQYNVLERRPEEFFPLFEKNNISVIARGSVAKGLLTNNWEKKLSTKGYLSYSEHECKETIFKLTQLLEEEQSLHSLALHYLLHHNVVSSLAIGARNKEQLLDNINAYYAKPLSTKQITQIQEISHFTKYEEHR